MTTAVFLGDSITAGYGVTTGFPATLSAGTGWTPILEAIPGTGYLAGHATSQAFEDRVAAVLAHSPDVIVMAGGTNDVNFPAGEEAIYTALVADQVEIILTAFAAVDMVYVLAPFNGIALPAPYVNPGRVRPFGAAIAAVAVAYSRPYVDLLNPPWLTGSGTVAAPTGDGNCDIYMSADGLHPSQAGQDYIAAQLLDWILTGGPIVRLPTAANMMPVLV